MIGEGAAWSDRRCRLYIVQVVVEGNMLCRWMTSEVR